MRTSVKSCDPARRWKRLAVVIVTPRDRRRWHREQTSMRVLTMLPKHIHSFPKQSRNLDPKPRSAGRKPCLTCCPPEAGLGDTEKDTRHIQKPPHIKNLKGPERF